MQSATWLRRFAQLTASALLTAALAAAPAQAEHEDEDDTSTDDPDKSDSSGTSGSSGSSGSSGGSGGDGSSTGEPPSHRLAESETAYTGAIMLEGEKDVEIGTVAPGSIGDPTILHHNARFIGNTLYAEATDEAGNAVAMVVEFYWFESSVPRGSDFFVAVVKGRTIPHLAERWVLEHEVLGTATDRFRPNRGATLYVRAETDPELNHGGFRWDWSLPFRDYSMDAYGTIRMNASYGVGLAGNGAAQKAYQVNEHGVEVELEGQVSGHLNNDFAVNTNYEVTLYRWDVYTRNSAGMLEWSLFLRTGDRERRNAYHEYFIAMQTPRDEEFRINRLEVGGHVKHKNDWWFDERRALSVAVEDVVITRPTSADRVRERDEEADPSHDDGHDDGHDDTHEDDDYRWSSDAGAFGDSPGGGGQGGCSAVNGGAASDHAGLALALFAMGLVLAARRRKS